MKHANVQTGLKFVLLLKIKRGVASSYKNPNMNGWFNPIIYLTKYFTALLNSNISKRKIHIQ